MLQRLAVLAIFDGFTTSELKLLEPIFQQVTFSAGDVIFEQGDQASSFYILLAGTASINYKPYDGPTIVITRANNGDVFGWSSVVGAQHYSSSAICETDCELLRVHGSDLRNLCINNQHLGSALLDRLSEIVSKRWQNSKEQVRKILTESVSNHIQKK